VDNLNGSTTYAVYIPAGAVKDLAGSSLTEEYIHPTPYTSLQARSRTSLATNWPVNISSGTSTVTVS